MVFSGTLKKRVRSRTDNCMLFLLLLAGTRRRQAARRTGAATRRIVFRRETFARHGRSRSELALAHSENSKFRRGGEPQRPNWGLRPKSPSFKTYGIGIQSGNFLSITLRDAAASRIGRRVFDRTAGNGDLGLD